MNGFRQQMLVWTAGLGLAGGLACAPAVIVHAQTAGSAFGKAFQDIDGGKKPAQPKSGQPKAAQPKSGGPAAEPTQPPPPVSILPVNLPPPQPSATPSPAAAGASLNAPLVEPIQHWPLADAQALLAFIQTVGSEGLIPADYAPDGLKAAIEGGEGANLDTVASTSFDWLAEDMRDGRTPLSARRQWFAVDKDVETNPTDKIEERALASHDIAGTLIALDPTYPDFAALKEELANTAKTETATRELIRVNMDRWRWFTRDLGEYYLMTNVPEFQLRLVRRDKIIRTYRTVVGKPGETATPQLAEQVQAVVFNPTWTIPQSIIKREYNGNPSRLANRGYKVTKSADGTYTVVQQPGPKNSLGLMKIDMPNPHAIYLHDTPAKALFNTPVRAYSHGCVRTERAMELGITLAILKAGKTPEEAVAISQTGKYTRVSLQSPMPVYIGYFTMAKSIDGAMKSWPDLYGRDGPVLDSFKQPRQLKTGKRTIDEKIKVIEDDR